MLNLRRTKAEIQEEECLKKFASSERKGQMQEEECGENADS